MSAVSYKTTACVFNDVMQTLWPDSVKCDLLLLVPDAASYMKKAAVGLSLIALN
jgi:hypothetical protein